MASLKGVFNWGLSDKTSSTLRLFTTNPLDSESALSLSRSCRFFMEEAHDDKSAVRTINNIRRFIVIIVLLQVEKGKFSK